MMCLNVNSIKDVQMSRQLLPLKKMFRLSYLRGQDKNTHVRAIANAFLENNYVKIEEGADLAKLTRDDVACVKELAL